jgi:hypothetical protein
MGIAEAFMPRCARRIKGGQNYGYCLSVSSP